VLIAIDNVTFTVRMSLVLHATGFLSVQYTTFHGTEYSFIHSFVHFNPEFKGNNNSEQTVGQDSKATRYALLCL